MSSHAEYAALVVAHACCVLERLDHEGQHGRDLTVEELERRELRLLEQAEAVWQRLNKTGP